MATIQDIYKIRGILTRVKVHHPCCEYLGAIQFGYASGKDCYTATTDSDLTIYFDDVEYHSNNIYLMKNGDAVATFCHLHQRIDRS